MKPGNSLVVNSLYAEPKDMEIIYSAWHVRRAMNYLERAGIIACPTESVYGLSCLAQIADAVAYVISLKQRPRSKRGLIIVAATVDQVLPWIDLRQALDWNTINATWPGAVTWIFPASSMLPLWLRGEANTVAIRISAHPLLQTLCRQLGPIISTSANPSRLSPAKNARTVRKYFSNAVDYIFPGYILGNAPPSRIRHAVTGKIFR